MDRLGRTRPFWICGISLTIPGYMVWCALLYAASGSWLTWRVGRPLVGMSSCGAISGNLEFRLRALSS